MPNHRPPVLVLLTDAQTGEIATPAQVAATFPGAEADDAEFGTWLVDLAGGYRAELKRAGFLHTTIGNLDVEAEWV